VLRVPLYFGIIAIVTFATITTSATASASQFESAKVSKRSASFAEMRAFFPQYASVQPELLDK
jgi:hypothetical protein